MKFIFSMMTTTAWIRGPGLVVFGLILTADFGAWSDCERRVINQAVVLSTGAGEGDERPLLEAGTIVCVEREAHSDQTDGYVVRYPGDDERLGRVNGRAIEEPAHGPTCNIFSVGGPGITPIDGAATDSSSAADARVDLPNPSDRASGNASVIVPGVEPPRASRRPSSLESLLSANQIGAHAHGQQLVADALSRSRELERDAASDNRRLRELYSGVPRQEMDQRLRRAEERSRQMARDIDASMTGIQAGEGARFKNMLLNAADKAAAAREMLAQQQDSPSRRAATGQGMSVASTDTVSLGVIGAEGLGPLQELFQSAAATASPTSSDYLVDRMMMMNGLPDAERRAAEAEMALASGVRVTLPDGTRKNLTLLHNGYRLGADSSTAMDCSSFVSSILPTDMRMGRFTTLDFKMMWKYLRQGHLPKPPRYHKNRAEQVIKTAEGFVPLNFHENDRPLPGDLLIYRPSLGTIGHVMLVRSYEPRSMKVRIIEAAQSVGTIRERDFKLSLDPIGAKRRFIRPGIVGLRVRPVATNACRYTGKYGGWKNGGARAHHSSSRSPAGLNQSR